MNLGSIPCVSLAEWQEFVEPRVMLETFGLVIYLVSGHLDHLGCKGVLDDDALKVEE